jgi:YegS/Rv2252/BmrU family lipid kinase
MTDTDHPTSDDTVSADSTDSDPWVVLNPTSGTTEHVEDIRREATERGYTVRETTHEGHAVRLAREAVVAGVGRLAVAGGDGTVNEVVQGLTGASQSGDVTLGVIPTGTENLFATTIGVSDVAHGFDLLEDGERRRIDVGFADDQPFVVSCISGLPAEISTAASSDLKAQFGSLAFVVAGLRELSDVSGLQIELTAISNGDETTWAGEALCALVGNARRFVNRGGQANVEDGLFDVVVIEQMPASDVLAEATAHRLFGRDTEHVRHVQASQLEIQTLDGEPITFSLDGEASTHDALTLHTKPQSLTVCVGSGYESTPTE